VSELAKNERFSNGYSGALGLYIPRLSNWRVVLLHFSPGNPHLAHLPCPRMCLLLPIIKCCNTPSFRRLTYFCYVLHLFWRSAAVFPAPTPVISTVQRLLRLLRLHCCSIDRTPGIECVLDIHTSTWHQRQQQQHQYQVLHKVAREWLYKQQNNMRLKLEYPCTKRAYTSNLNHTDINKEHSCCRCALPSTQFHSHGRRKDHVNKHRNGHGFHSSRQSHTNISM
jgi:hypothetical protein